MTVENISWSISMKECCQTGGGRTRNLLITSWMCIQLSHPGWILFGVYVKSLFTWHVSFDISNTPGPCYGQIQQTTNWRYFSYFAKKIGFDTSCKLSPKETIWMMCQILFSRKNKKSTSKCCLLNFFQACSVNTPGPVLGFLIYCIIDHL